MQRTPRLIEVTAAVVATLVVALLAAAAPAAAAAPEPAPAAAQLRVDINIATEAQLTALPGIGEAIARRIVEFREQHGPFRRVEDLLKVRGIGEKSLDKLRPSITVGPPSTK